MLICAPLVVSVTASFICFSDRNTIKASYLFGNPPQKNLFILCTTSYRSKIEKLYILRDVTSIRRYGLVLQNCYFTKCTNFIWAEVLKGTICLIQPLQPFWRTWEQTGRVFKGFRFWGTGLTLSAFTCMQENKIPPSSSIKCMRIHRRPNELLTSSLLAVVATR